IYTNRTLNFPDVVLPPQLSFAPVAPIVGIGGNKTNWITANGYYTINNDYPIVVATNVTAYLGVTSATFDSLITLQGGITNSAAAYIYFSGNSATITSFYSGRPRNLQIFGLPSLTSLTLSGVTSFTGVIYAPSASVTLNGGGGANSVMGSL